MLKPHVSVRGKRNREKGVEVRIGELAGATGVSVRALRYYEGQDLLSSTRSASGQRHYAPDASDRVNLIQELYQAGLSSKTMVAFFPCIVDPVNRTPALEQDLRAERARIDSQISDLSHTRDKLDEVIETLRI